MAFGEFEIALPEICGESKLILELARRSNGVGDKPGMVTIGRAS